MDDKLFAELLNNTKELTILQILKIIMRIKYRTLTLFITTFMALGGSIYMAGRTQATQHTAVMLQSPFSMRLMLNEQPTDFEHLTLLQDPMIPSPTPDLVLLSLRQVKSPFDIVPIGQIVAKSNAGSKSIWSRVFASNFISSAHAQSDFNWGPHINDTDYTEAYINKETIHRTYSDGCVLEYRLDNNRKAVPSSFVWITYTH